MVDLHNAHIRKPQTSGEDQSIAADDARRLLQDPAFVRGHERLRDELIRIIEDGKDDGSVQFEEQMLETCRTLRTLKSLRRMIGATIQGAELREAGFKPRSPETEED